MKTPEKIFLCWSKRRSRSIATAWAALLPEVIKDIQPIVSTEFQKGKEWSMLLRRDLDEARTGIVFLTPENVDAPWIHFEAGALATAVGRRNGDVFTYVYGFDAGQLAGPLSAYHSTVATRVDTQRLVRDLCAELDRDPPDEAAYSAWWVKLEEALSNVPSPGIQEIVPGFAGLFERKTFQEPLPDCTNQRWLDRFAAARAAHQTLSAASRAVDDLGRPGARQLYRELVAAVDGYAMAMSGFLVTEKHFDFDEDGKLAAPKGAIAACELRRRRVNGLSAMLADPKNDTPVFGESVAFAELEPEHRKSFIYAPILLVAGLEQGRRTWQPTSRGRTRVAGDRRISAQRRRKAEGRSAVLGDRTGGRSTAVAGGVEEGESGVSGRGGAGAQVVVLAKSPSHQQRPVKSGSGR